jgi:hypothetical protein
LGGFSLREDNQKEYFPQVSYTTEEIDEMAILRQDIQSFAG